LESERRKERVKMKRRREGIKEKKIEERENKGEKKNDEKMRMRD